MLSKYPGDGVCGCKGVDFVHSQPLTPVGTNNVRKSAIAKIMELSQRLV